MLPTCQSPRIVLCLLLFSFATVLSAAEPKRVLLVGQGPDNHPPGTHEYLAGLERLAKLLAPHPELSTELVKADEPWAAGPEQIDKAQGVVLFASEGAKFVSADPRRYEAFTRLAARGGGLLVLHWGMGTRAVEPIGPFVRLFGGCHGGPDRKYQVVDVELKPAKHPITEGLSPFSIHDEFYYRLKFPADKPGVEPVLTCRIDGDEQTVAWAWQRPTGGRSFGFSGLHFDANWQRPEYQRLLERAVLWTMGELPAR